MHWRRNADEGLRELERRAAAGDPEAQAAVVQERLRTGQDSVQWLVQAGPDALAAFPPELTEALEGVLRAARARQADDRLMEGLTVGELQKRLSRYPPGAKILLGINVGNMELEDAVADMENSEGLYVRLDEVGMNYLPTDREVRLDGWWGPGGPGNPW